MICFHLKAVVLSLGCDLRSCLAKEPSPCGAVKVMYVSPVSPVSPVCIPCALCDMRGWARVMQGLAPIPHLHSVGILGEHCDALQWELAAWSGSPAPALCQPVPISIIMMPKKEEEQNKTILYILFGAIRPSQGKSQWKYQANWNIKMFFFYEDNDND